MVQAILACALIAAPSQADDHASVDSAVAALYDVISGPPGKRDWDRFRALFPEGGMLRAVVRAQDGTRRIVEMTPENYIERNKAALESSAFYEREVHRVTEQFGDVASVWSTYESRREPDGRPFQRGINSISLRFDGARWLIVSVLWQAESDSNPIPSKYLPPGG